MPTQSGCFQLVELLRSSQAPAATTTSTSSSTAIRRAFHTRYVPSGLEPRSGPRACFEISPRQLAHGALPARPVVNSPSAFYPQLDILDPQPVAAPVRRSWNLHVAGGIRSLAIRHGRPESLGSSLQGGSQFGPRLDRLALLAGPRPQPALPRTGSEILVTVGGMQPVHNPLQPHLPVKMIPMEHRRGARIRRKLAPLVRPIVRIKDDESPFRDHRFAKDDARRRRTVLGDG